MAFKNGFQKIKLEKTCSIDGVTDLTDRIREALAKSSSIEFDLSEVAEMELPVMQALYAAARSAASAGGCVNLAGTIQKSVASRLMVAGFTKTMAKDGKDLQAGLTGFGVLDRKSVV